MSHASLENALDDDKEAWKQNLRLSLSGTSDVALDFFLNKHDAVKELVFCLDSDSAGVRATASMTKKYAEKGYRTEIQFPTRKDFNEDLQDLVKQIRAGISTKNRSHDVSF